VADNDIIRDLIDRIATAVPEMSVECAVSIEREARAHWGGSDVHVPADPGRESRRRAAVIAWRNGVPIDTIRSSLGIGRATIYRIVKQQRGTCP